ncbi:hypothetical protein A0H81_05533 [Grifola frondosa]|uniref:Mid2 domain-containing protein n=1 Tax=Grifola frondosa TaxID=5627 RepID=A0A1C7MBY4_GRIFR|nr:hypothetical protein A0H81_05533 [Grifola frondosa]
MPLDSVRGDNSGPLASSISFARRDFVSFCFSFSSTVSSGPSGGFTSVFSSGFTFSTDSPSPTNTASIEGESVITDTSSPTFTVSGLLGSQTGFSIDSSNSVVISLTSSDPSNSPSDPNPTTDPNNPSDPSGDPSTNTNANPSSSATAAFPSGTIVTTPTDTNSLVLSSPTSLPEPNSTTTPLPIQTSSAGSGTLTSSTAISAAEHSPTINGMSTTGGGTEHTIHASSKNRAEIIAGAVVGGVIGLTLIFLALFFIYRRRKNLMKRFGFGGASMKRPESSASWIGNRIGSPHADAGFADDQFNETTTGDAESMIYAPSEATLTDGAMFNGRRGSALPSRPRRITDTNNHYGGPCPSLDKPRPSLNQVQTSFDRPPLGVTPPAANSAAVPAIRITTNNVVGTPDFITDGYETVSPSSFFIPLVTPVVDNDAHAEWRMIGSSQFLHGPAKRESSAFLSRQSSKASSHNSRALSTRRGSRADNIDPLRNYVSRRTSRADRVDAWRSNTPSSLSTRLESSLSSRTSNEVTREIVQVASNSVGGRPLPALPDSSSSLRTVDSRGMSSVGPPSMYAPTF